MKVQVNGHQINIGESLRQNVEAKLVDCVPKYSDRPINANVTFSREAHEFKCSCLVHISTGLTAQAEANANDIHSAYELAISKVEKQLRRHKRRLKDHHRKAHVDAEQISQVQAKSYVLTINDEEHDDEEAPETAQDLQPPIVAEMTTDIRRLSVGAAVMHMEFQDLPVLMFQNEKHGGLNVVYKREDGSIGWIDPNLITNTAVAV